MAIEVISTGGTNCNSVAEFTDRMKIALAYLRGNDDWEVMQREAENKYRKE